LFDKAGQRRAFRRKVRVAAERADDLPQKAARLQVARETYEVAGARVKQVEWRRVVLTARLVGIAPDRFERDHAHNPVALSSHARA